MHKISEIQWQKRLKGEKKLGGVKKNFCFELIHQRIIPAQNPTNPFTITTLV
jgi:hypothetical protein